MNRLGKDLRFLLTGLTAVLLGAILLAMGITIWMNHNLKEEMLSRDYEVAGFLIRHPETQTAVAFTKEKTAADWEIGREALEKVGYSVSVDASLLPVIGTFQKHIIAALAMILFFVFASVYFFIFCYIRRQRMAMEHAEKVIGDFLEGDYTVRIECEEVGGWNPLFHKINVLATTLASLAEREMQTKTFLQDIISDISHQMKTPLAALKMYNEIICDERTERSDIVSFGQKSLREIKRIEDVFYTLLKLARLDAGTIQMDKRNENVSALICDVLDRFAVWAEQKEIEITVSGSSDTQIACDALWLSEAIGNLIKNALEHTEKGGKIHICWEQTALLTNIIIQDNGKGIHPEDIHNIWKRFYRSRFSQDVHGVGLGLPLAKAIMEAHHGTISVTSKPNRGTTFTLHFFDLTKE